MDVSFLFGLSGRFALVTSGLCRVIGACLGRGRMEAAMLVLVVARVARAQRLLLALMARLRAGEQVRGRVRLAEGPGVVSKTPLRATPDADRLVLPRRFGWLVGLVGFEAAGAASQLSALLVEPEMAALVRDVPQARRILAPLCRMLGVEIAGMKRVRRRTRPVMAVASGCALGASVTMPRPGYVASAKWPAGVVTPRRARAFSG